MRSHFAFSRQGAHDPQWHGRRPLTARAGSRCKSALRTQGLSVNCSFERRAAIADASASSKRNLLTGNWCSQVFFRPTSLSAEDRIGNELSGGFTKKSVRPGSTAITNGSGRCPHRCPPSPSAAPPSGKRRRFLCLAELRDGRLHIFQFRRNPRRDHLGRTRRDQDVVFDPHADPLVLLERRADSFDDFLLLGRFRQVVERLRPNVDAGLDNLAKTPENEKFIEAV